MGPALTVGELCELEVRVDEIVQTLDLCDPDVDADVIDNLVAELEDIERRILRSIAAHRGRHLRLVV